MVLSSAVVIAVLEDAEYCGPLPLLGFSLNNFRAYEIISSLCRAGLLEENGGFYDITELGKTILNNPQFHNKIVISYKE